MFLPYMVLKLHKIFSLKIIILIIVLAEAMIRKRRVSEEEHCKSPMSEGFTVIVFQLVCFILKENSNSLLQYHEDSQNILELIKETSNHTPLQYKMQKMPINLTATSISWLHPSGSWRCMGRGLIVFQTGINGIIHNIVEFTCNGKCQF